MLHRNVRETAWALGFAATLLMVGAPNVLHAASMTVREPAFGIPHFYGDTELELARENGREIAKDRLGQLILLARVGHGTLAQALGVLDPGLLADDIEARRTGYTSSELNLMFANAPERDRQMIIAYCEGVNDTIDEIYAGNLPEPLEVTLIRNTLGLPDDLFGNATNVSDQVDPFYKAPGGADPERPNGGFQYTPELAMAIAVLEIRTFGVETFNEQQRLAELQALVAKHGDVAGGQIWDDLNFLNDPLAPVTVPDPTTPGFGGPLAARSIAAPALLAARFPTYDYATGALEREEAALLRAERARSLGAWPAMGSIAWLISGGRSETGYPWVGGFPQTGIQTPSIMHVVQNRSGENISNRINAIGMEFAGAPLTIIGHTDNVAYTTTTAHLRTVDTVFEKIISEDSDALTYNDEGSPAPLIERTEIFRGGLGADITRVFWRSHERGGNAGSRPIVDFVGDAEGTADSATATSLTDVGAFPASLAGGYVAIVGGTGAGQIREIDSVPSADSIDVTSGWTTIPDATSEYVAAAPGKSIIAVAEDSVSWLEEMTSVVGFLDRQRSESLLDVRKAARLTPNTLNSFAADNRPFNGIGTQSGNGNIGYWSTGFSRYRNDDLDPRLPIDGSVANPLIVASGAVKKATSTSLEADGSAFAGQDFTPPTVNFRYENPSEKGSEYVVAITSGTGYKQTRRIASNTGSGLVIESPWGTIPGKDATFEVYRIVAMPEAINPSEGYTANWNNKAATADEGQNNGRFGRQYEHIFILERLAADTAWDREKSRQLNKDFAGQERPLGGDAGARYLVPRLRQAVDAVGTGGNGNVESILSQLEAFLGSPFFGRNFIDPVTATTNNGGVELMTNLANQLAEDIYGDELDSAVSVPNDSWAVNLVLHAIDSAAGDVSGSYAQSYAGDYFNGQGWETVVRDALSTVATSSSLPADSPRGQSRYRHPLAALFPELEFEPTPFGQRGTYEQIIDVGPTLTGEYIFPLGQSGLIEGSIVGVTSIDPNVDSLQPLWRDWRFAPMLNVFGASPDRFLCYKAKTTPATPKFAGSTIELTDEFETGEFDVKKTRAVCVGSATGDADAAQATMQSYQIKGLARHTKQLNIELPSPFGPVTVDTNKPDRLLVPTVMQLGAAPADSPDPSADVFKCYKVKTSKGTPKLAKGLQFDFTDVFESRQYDIKKVTRLCNPVEESNAPGKRILCYQAKAAKGEAKHEKVTGLIHTTNEFGDEQLDTNKEEEVCVTVSLDVVDPDTDGDGVLDGYERWYFGDLLDDATTDSDVDGLDLLGEFAAGSDPTSSDTDDDGTEDGTDAFPQDRLLQ